MDDFATRLAAANRAFETRQAALTALYTEHSEANSAIWSWSMDGRDFQDVWALLAPANWRKSSLFAPDSLSPYLWMTAKGQWRKALYWRSDRHREILEKVLAQLGAVRANQSAQLQIAFRPMFSDPLAEDHSATRAVVEAIRNKLAAERSQLARRLAQAARESPEALAELVFNHTPEQLLALPPDDEITAIDASEGPESHRSPLPGATWPAYGGPDSVEKSFAEEYIGSTSPQQDQEMSTVRSLLLCALRQRAALAPNTAPRTAPRTEVLQAASLSDWTTGAAPSQHMPVESSRHEVKEKAYLIPTLNRLRDQLSDLTMRNRSLRLCRLPKNRAFDLACLDERGTAASASALKQLLSGRNVAVKLLDVGGDDPSTQPIHRGLTYLDREVRLVEQERGVYDLSVGVGFLCGNIAEGRYLQAPLCLLPRRLILERRARDGARWVLQPIGDADSVEVNRTLLLALQRFLDVSIDPDEIEELLQPILFSKTREGTWPETLAKELAELLGKYGLSVTPAHSVWGAVPTSLTSLPPLPVYKADDLPMQPVRRFELRSHAVLCRFPLADTAVLDDYDRFIKMLEVEPRHRLGYAGALLGDGDARRQVQEEAGIPATTSPRMHIEPTDESQELVLARAVAGHSMAVHGPPGTGKSQLIANLVATAAGQGKKILVVSQKRAALDVVAQRLGADLARFVAVVHDPVRDRQALFDRIMAGVDAANDEVLSHDDSRRKRALTELSGAEAWFSQVHTAMSSLGSSGRNAAEIYAERMGASEPLQAGLARSLPAMDHETLIRDLAEVEPYLAQVARARPVGSWQESRPDWSDFDKDDYDGLLEESLPALALAISRESKWVEDAPVGTPSLGQAARDHANWRALGEWASSVGSLPELAWALALRPREASGSVEGDVGGTDIPDLWDAGTAQHLVPLERAALDNAAWTEIANWARSGLGLSADAWPWMVRMPPGNNNGGWSARIEGEFAVLHALLHIRDAADGRVVDLGSAQVTEAALSAFEQVDRRWYRFASPQWYGAKRAAAQLLGVPTASAVVQTASAVWRMRRTYAEGLLTAPAQMPILTSFGLRPDLISATAYDELQAAAQAAAAVADDFCGLGIRAKSLVREMPDSLEAMTSLHQTALRGVGAKDLFTNIQALASRAVKAWVGLPGRCHGLVAVAMPDRERAASLLKVATHALLAKPIAEGSAKAGAEIATWVGSSVEPRIAEAVSLASGEDLVMGLKTQISSAFSTAWDSDRRCRAFERRAPALAHLARRLGGTSNVAAQIRAAYAERAVRDLEASQPVLREVTNDELHVRRERLLATWRSLPSLNRGALRAILVRRATAPRVYAVALRQRAAQRRKRWSLRKLVEHFWDDSLSQLLPIWLCSPETVAAAFPFRSDVFDLVIFDEASQLTVARGLTSAFRGRTCIVAGDDQQLPPSNFFSVTLEDDEEGIIEEETEESLLAKAKSTSAESGLQWHYRSRFPELIQFSNVHFYNGTLRVAPVPIAHAEPAPVEWVDVPGAWNRATNTNEAEALLAVELVHRYLDDHVGKSVGIITLNRQQSDRIEDIIADRSANNMKFRSLWDAANQRGLDERPFVRNIENVQGDERDVTILSIGYSADASGRVPLRFGALTVSGGERRLNVAVSRAREKMVVLCSFDPEAQMDVQDSKSAGAKTLKSFLLYARSGGQRTAATTRAATTDDARGMIARQIGERLAEHGWIADLDFGHSVARVDIAIRSRESKLNYVMALLLDGPGTAWAQTDIGREVGKVEYLARYQWHVRVVPMRAWAMAAEETLNGLLVELADLDSRPARPIPAPSVALPARQAIAASPHSAPSVIRTRAARPALPSQSQLLDAGALPAGVAAESWASDVRDAAPEIGQAGAAPRPLSVQPGSTVRYRKLSTGDVRETILTGPTLARGVKSITLDAPLARALLDAAVGDVVQMDLSGEEIELEVLEVLAPPRGT